MKVSMEQRRHAIEMIEAGAWSQADAARAYGITAPAVRRWRNQAGQSGITPAGRRAIGMSTGGRSSGSGMSLIDYRTKYSDVFDLYDKGMSFQAIATSLGTTKGRVAGIVLRYKQKLEATS